MILGRDLIIALVLDLKFSENIVIGSEVPYGGCSVPMVDVNNYYFKPLTEKQLNHNNHLLTRTSTNALNPRAP